MALYKIRWRRSAVKAVKKIDRNKIPNILQAIEQLAENPTPINYKKMVGTAHSYRIRVGDYRIVYEIINEDSLSNFCAPGYQSSTKFQNK